MRRREVPAALIAASAASVLLPREARSQTCTAPCYATSGCEGTAVTNKEYLPGNALRYGADPTGVAPSGAAIQAAINVGKSCGIAVYIPGGSYSMGTTALTVSGEFQRIYGDGGQTQLNWSPSFTGTALAIDSDTFQMQDIYIQKPYQTSPPTSGIGIVNNSNTWELINVEVSSQGSGDLGWYIGVEAKSYVMKMVNCRVSAYHQALQTSAANALFLVNCNFSAQDINGTVCQIEGSSAGGMTNCDIEGAAQYGIVLEPVGAHSTFAISGCYMEGQKYAIYILGAAGPPLNNVGGVSIVGNFINGDVGPGSYGIWANYASGLTITGNEIFGHTVNSILLGNTVNEVLVASNDMSSPGNSGWVAVSVGTGVNGIIQTAPSSYQLGGPATMKLGFFDRSPILKPTVTGAKAGNAALTSLVSALSSLGLITDSTT
jgi:hypothetical protein